MSTTITNVRTLPLTALVLSQTSIQVERRAQFNQEALKELSATIKAVGRVEQAITVRPLPRHGKGEESFEVVDGERRYHATQMANLPEILAEVRDLPDDQVETIQIVTGLQKEGLHELVEAEGYETLLKRGQSVDEIAAKCGKSKGTVYARMKLLALCPEARNAFRNGKVSASVALLLARIPVAELQQQALEHILKPNTWNDEPLTYRATLDYIHKEFTLRLSEAPFPRDDADLVPSAGTCGACPKRTGNQPELFGDIKGADICTDPTCFKVKKMAHVKRELEKAKTTGERVIRGGEAKRILPDSRQYWHDSEGAHKQLRAGYARPSDKCLDDPKKRTYAELAGKDAPRVLLQNPDTGRVEKVFEVAAIADRLKAKGITPPKKARDPEQQRQLDKEVAEQQRKEETTARCAIFQAILKAAPTKLPREDLATLISKSFNMGFGTDDDFYAALGWEMPKEAKAQRNRVKSEELFYARLLKVTDSELAQIAVAITVIEDVLTDWDKPVELEALARRFAIDPKKIRAELKPVATKVAKPAPAKASKKKAR
jgi:ParB/RepB/Spo0J family partition protein